MTDQEIRLKFGEMNAGEMRLARALVAWHEREITKLKEDLTHAERWRDKLDTKLTEVVEAAERAGWDSVENSKNLPTFITYLAEDLSKAQAELAALRQPILADDGRSLGQVACEYYHEAYGVGTVEKWQRAAQAVAAVVLAQAVRRMEAVPVEELCDAYEAAYTSYGGMGAVRARLIEAAKGEGQAVVVNEPPQDEGQPDLSGESEKQDPFEELKAAHAAGNVIEYRDASTQGIWQPCISPGWFGDAEYRIKPEPTQAQPTTSPGWTPTVGDTVRLKSGGPVMTVTHVDPLSLMCAWMNASNELQVEPITTLCLESAQP